MRISLLALAKSIYYINKMLLFSVKSQLQLHCFYLILKFNLLLFNKSCDIRLSSVQVK